MTDEPAALNLTGRSPAPEEEKRAGRGSSRWIVLVLALLLLLGAGAGYRFWQRLERMEAQALDLTRRMEDLASESRNALARATEEERAALEAAGGRERAESEAASAQEDARSARVETQKAQETAASAEERAKAAEQEAERIRRDTENEMNRLQEALNQIAETRRTALGLVMNLGSDYLKFDFDKDTVRPENRELLSRIAGILLTSKDYNLTVHGHTDDIGSEQYNQDLSERRARAVRDYLLEAGINGEVITTEGFGKSRPLVPGTSERARAKNRRVELGIVSTRVEYLRGPGKPK